MGIMSRCRLFLYHNLGYSKKWFLVTGLKMFSNKVFDEGLNGIHLSLTICGTWILFVFRLWKYSIWS